MKARLFLGFLQAFLVTILFGFSSGGVSWAQSKLFIPVKDEDSNDPLPLFVKVIVNKGDVAVYREPDGAVLPERVNYFDIFYKLYSDDKEESKGPYFRIGNDAGKPLGWIKKENLIEWKSRYILEPKPPVDDLKFKVYYKDDPTKVVATFKKGATGKLAVAPILARPKDPKKPLYQVAFFAGVAPRATIVHAGKQEPVANRETGSLSKLKVEIVFVIDTTASMTPLIKGTKEIVRLTTEELSRRPELKDVVRFGLVEFQDDVPGLVNSRRVCELTSDLKMFKDKLEPLKEATIGSIDTPEQVLAGLKEAIENGGWSQNSVKHIILLGDASAHLGPKDVTKLHSIEALVDLASGGGGSNEEKAKNMRRLHAVRAISSDPSDHERAKEHFQKVAKNNGRFEGVYEELDPNDQAAIDRVVKSLVGKLSVQLERVIDIRNGRDLPLQTGMVGSNPFVDALYEIESSFGGKFDPVDIGWARDREQGHMIAEKKVFVLEKELKILKSQLEIIYEAFGDVDPKNLPDVEEILKKLQSSVTSAVSGQDFRKDTPLKRVIATLPLTTDALDKTPEDIKRLTVPAFNAWRESLRGAIIRARVALEKDDNWHDLSSLDQKKKRFAFLLQGQLP